MALTIPKGDRMKRIICGNVTTTHFWEDIDIPSGKTRFNVQISNSIPSEIKMDVCWPAVYPGWELLNSYKKDKNVEEYTKRYLYRLAANEEEVRFGWWRIVEQAPPNSVITLNCWEKAGFCHRRLLIKWMFKAGMINAVLDIDRVVCAQCWEEFNAIEKEETGGIVGFTYDVPCEICLEV